MCRWFTRGEYCVFRPLDISFQQIVTAALTACIFAAPFNALADWSIRGGNDYLNGFAKVITFLLIQKALLFCNV
jgi:hypothetical protein